MAQNDKSAFPWDTKEFQVDRWLITLRASCLVEFHQRTARNWRDTGIFVFVIIRVLRSTFNLWSGGDGLHFEIRNQAITLSITDHSGHIKPRYMRQLPFLISLKTVAGGPLIHDRSQKIPADRTNLLKIPSNLIARRIERLYFLENSLFWCFIISINWNIIEWDGSLRQIAR
jgi:hypothetical protein